MIGGERTVCVTLRLGKAAAWSQNCAQHIQRRTVSRL